jgi:nicotinate-nucleotide--dimethylbenzimidazole phosphoribosyltransferase
LEQTLVEQIREQWKRCGASGSQLGRIETLVTQYCMLKGAAKLPTPRLGLFVFCADGASSSGLAMARSLSVHQGVALHHPSCAQEEPARDSVRRPLDRQAFQQQIQAGRAEVLSAAEHFDFVAVGEHSCSGSLAASLITGALLEMNAIDVTGREPGQDIERYLARIHTVEIHLQRRETRRGAGQHILAQYGGHSFARLAGFLLGAEEAKLPVMLDGFATAAAALCAVRMSPGLRNYLFFSHRSPEPGHGYLLDAMAAEPLLDLQIWCGDGIGALLALGLFQSAWQIYSGLPSSSSGPASSPNK